MASSNRHWPSMFKSKPCNTHHHQWQHDINSSSLISSTTNCHRAGPFSSGPGGEERSPEPKPRWNPKPEQIRILEAIFNSGMVNPPRDEIRRIRGQLQEYGQVGDANVFYWFQNRKSRSKHKQRHLLQNTKNNSQNQTPPPPPPPPTHTTSSIITAPSSSSSSSEKSSPKAATMNNNNNNKMTSFSVGSSSNPIDHHHLSNNSPTGSVNQTTYFHPSSSSHSHGELIMTEPFFFPVQQQTTTDINNTNGNGVFSSQGFCFSDLSNVVQFPDHHHHQAVGSCPGFLLSELMMNNNNNNNQGGSKKVEDEEKMKLLHHQLSYTTHAHHVVPTIDATTTVTVPLSVNQVQGVGETGGVGQLGSARSTVFINDVAFEMAVGSFNLRECFGDDAVLIHSSGQTVLTNEWGVTLQPLQHGACYYLI